MPTLNQANASKTHLIMIPSYNTGEILEKTIREVLHYYAPVWVIIDGSNDGSDLLLSPLLAQFPHSLKVIKLPENIGKGAAILKGITQAKKHDFSHVLTMDADLQHSANSIADFINQSKTHPKAMILGKPVFAESAPALRVQGRRISNGWANLETLNKGIGDSLFGMRVYPIDDLIAVMNETRWARRFDFEPEVAVRLAWRNIPIINLETPVRYLAIEEGGVSQFRYLRDNALLTAMHTRLFFGFLGRLPKFIIQSLRKT